MRFPLGVFVTFMGVEVGEEGNGGKLMWRVEVNEQHRGYFYNVTSWRK